MSRLPPPGVSVRRRASYRRCGKSNCATCAAGPGHGPYWYAHWREGKKVRSLYLGLRPPELRDPVPFRAEALGGLAVTRTDGSSVALTGRVRDLFTLLLSAPYARVGREEIAESIWPEHDSMAAHQNHRSTIAALRRKLGSPSLVRLVGPAVVLSLPPDSRDDQAFEAAGREALATGRPGLIERALDLYRGTYLPQDQYSDWTIYRRDLLRSLWRELVLMASHEPGIPSWRRLNWLKVLMSEEPTDEPGAEALIRTLVDSGRRSEALQVLRQVESAVRAELEAEPSSALSRLRDQVRLAPG